MIHSPLSVNGKTSIRPLTKEREVMTPEERIEAELDWEEECHACGALSEEDIERVFGEE